MILDFPEQVSLEQLLIQELCKVTVFITYKTSLNFASIMKSLKTWSEWRI